MTRTEAIRAALDGEKMRAVDFAPGLYFIYDKTITDETPFRLKDSDDESKDEEFSGCFGTEDTEFEIYHHPKKKVDMWLWAYQVVGRPSPTNNFYATKEEAEDATGATVTRLDWSKTPFEVE